MDKVKKQSLYYKDDYRRRKWRRFCCKAIRRKIIVQWHGTPNKWGQCQSVRPEDLSIENPGQASCGRWMCSGTTQAKTNESAGRIPRDKNESG